MSEPAPAERSGHCLCGAVAFDVGGHMEDVLHCHCENCRRLTGNFIASARTPWSELRFSEVASLRWYDVEYARYGFCGECGSTLFFVPQDNPERVSISAGVLDDVADLKLGSVWFAAEAQPHNLLPPDVPHHAGNG